MQKGVNFLSLDISTELLLQAVLTCVFKWKLNAAIAIDGWIKK